MKESSNLNAETDRKLSIRENALINENDAIELNDLVKEIKTENNEEALNNNEENIKNSIFDENLQKFLNNLTKENKNTKFISDIEGKYNL